MRYSLYSFTTEKKGANSSNTLPGIRWHIILQHRSPRSSMKALYMLQSVMMKHTI